MTLHIHISVEGGSTALQWPIQHGKIGPGPDWGMKDAPMKMEPEVIADPKGTAVNLSLAQRSLGP